MTLVNPWKKTLRLGRIKKVKGGWSAPKKKKLVKFQEVPTVTSCEECELRFKCFTEPRDARPRKIKGYSLRHSVNCGSCRSFIERKNAIGICIRHDMLVHITNSCEDHDLKNTKWYKEVKPEEIRTNIMRTLRRKYNGLPRLCIIKEGEENGKQNEN